MQKLRDKHEGCPWDIEQTFESLSKYAIEEAYELADAIANKDNANIKEELGDLLLQIIFHSQIASEKTLFNFDEVAQGLNNKLIRRHPHVFSGGVKLLTAAEQTESWKAIKKIEKKNNLDQSLFGNIPNSMPAILRAEKIQKAASKKGFDWDNINDVILKVEEEIQELKEALISESQTGIKEEFGDLLFSIVNLSRHLSLDSNEVLQETNKKFIKGFHLMQLTLKNNNQAMEIMSLSELDLAWNKVKKDE